MSKSKSSLKESIDLLIAVGIGHKLAAFIGTLLSENPKAFSGEILVMSAAAILYPMRLPASGAALMALIKCRRLMSIVNPSGNYSFKLGIDLLIKT